MSQVATLLQLARAAHDAYRMALPRFDVLTKQMIPGDADAAGRHLRRAFDLRAQAEDADQAEVSTAWADEAVSAPHYALLQFYDSEDRKRTREPRPERPARG